MTPSQDTASAVAVLAPAPRHELMVLLFRNCMEFTLSSSRFISKTQELRRVGINAQMLAARSSAGAKVLGVLVSEIGRMTREMTEVLQRLSASGRTLGGTAMRASSAGQQLIRYQRAWQLGVQGQSGARLALAYDGRLGGMFDQLREVRVKLLEHLAELQDLEERTAFIPALVSLIKINVAQFREFEQQFLATCDELNQFRQFITEANPLMCRAVMYAVGAIDQLLLGGSEH